MRQAPPGVDCWSSFAVTLMMVGVGAAACGKSAPADGGGDAPTAEVPADAGIDDHDPPSSPLICRYQGLTYASDTTFLSNDGCNACQCAYGGQVTCGTKTCPVAGVTCTLDGTSYAAGDLVPAARASDCDTCACAASGEIACTHQYCPTGKCVFGFDDTCNEDPTVREPRGVCQPNGTCACAANPMNPDTGRCLSPAHDVQSGCELGGAIHPDGSSFLCADGCNSCGCVGRDVYPTTINNVCGAYACALDDVVVFGYVGDDGLDQVVTLPAAPAAAPALTYVHARTDTAGATASCSPSLPACGDPDIVDLSNISVDLQDPIVHELLANPGPQPVVLGAIASPALSVRRGTGPGLVIGGDCDGSKAACNAIPDGVRRLAYDLRELDNQGLDKSRSCEALAPPTFACGATACNSRTEYCASVQANGAHLLDVCRPYPSGCDSCGCARDDALPAMRQVYPGCDVSFTGCGTGARTLGPDDVSATLTIACTEA